MATLGFVLRRLAAQRLLALALVVTLGFTIGVLVAGPIYADAAREAILSSEVLTQGVGVVNARLRIDGSADFPYEDSDARIEQSLEGIPLQRLTRQGRATVRIDGAGERQVSVPLLFRDGAEEVVPIEEGGRYPEGPGEIALPRSIARQLRVEVGDTVEIATADGTRQVTVTGLYPPIEAQTDFWYGLQSPFPDPDSTQPQPALTTREGFVPLAEELGLLPEYIWDAYTDFLGARFVEVKAMPARLDAALDRMHEEDSLARLSLTTGLATLVNIVEQRTANLGVPIYLVVFQVGAVALAVLAGVASLALSRQSFELAVLKSRGFTRGTLLGAQAVQTVVTAILAYPIGLLIGMGLAKLATGANGPAPEGVTFPVELSSAALVAGVIGAAVGSLILILTSIPFVSRTVIEERRAISREERPLIARYPWEIFVAILGLAAFWEVRTSGFLKEEGSLDPLVLLAPTLLLFAASFFVLRILLLIFRWLDRTLGKTRALSAYLAARRLGRSPGTAFATSLLLVLAAGLLVVSTSYRGIVVRNHDDAAHQDVGADWRVEVGAPEQSLAMLRAVPDGATAVIRTEPNLPVQSGGVPPVAIGVDPETFGQGGWWRDDYAQVPFDDVLSRLESPPAGVEVPEGTTSIEVTVEAPPEAAGLVVQATVEGDDGTMTLLEMGPLQTGLFTYSAPVEDGQAARLMTVSFLETPQVETPELLDLFIQHVEAVGQSRFAFDLATWTVVPWRGTEGTVTPENDGISIVVDPGSSHVVAAIRPPEEPLPVVLTSGLSAVVPDTFALTMGGQTLEFRKAGTVTAWPTSIGEVVVLPAPGLLERSGRLPDATLSLNEVWANGEDPRPALAEAGFLTSDTRDAESQITVLSQLPQSLAVGMHFTAATGGMGLVVIGVSVGLYFMQRRREFEFAALRAMGVDKRQVTTVLLLEQAILVGFAVLAGFALGLTILRLMMPYVGKSLGAAFPAPLMIVDWRALAIFGGAILAATAVGLLLALRSLLRSSVTSILRGEAE
jgi:hypothetical protein